MTKARGVGRTRADTNGRRGAGLARRTQVLGVLAVSVALAACEGPGVLGVGGGPQRGGTLRVGIERVLSLDPAQARTPDQLFVAEQLFDTLTSLRAGAGDGARPGLARSWQASRDQRTWEFRLRPDARFANGRAVTGADVKYSLERVSRRAAASPAAELLELVTGFGPFADGQAPELAGVTVVAPDVVRISLDQPWSVLPEVLAAPTLGIVPRESVEAAPPAPPFDETPVGSGPFRVGDRDDRRIVLVPRPGADVGVDRVDLVQHESAAASYGEFASGGLDVSRVPTEQVAAAARRYGDDGYRPSAAMLFYGFNLRHPLLADQRVREAVVRAVDRRAVVRAVYRGAAEPTDAVVPASDDGPAAGCRRCDHDPARARALLGQVFDGAPPPTVHVDVDDDPGQRAVAESIVRALRSVGLPAELRVHGAAGYRDFLASGRQEIFRLGWIASYPSPDAVLPPLFAKGSPSNLTGYDDAAVDEGLRAARAEPDAERRASLYRAASVAVLDDLAVIPLAQLRTHVVSSRRVHGLDVDLRGGFDAAAIRLDR